MRGRERAGEREEKQTLSRWKCRGDLAAVFLKWLRHTTVTTLTAILFLFHLRNKDFLQATWGLCHLPTYQARPAFYKLRAHTAWLQRPVRGIFVPSPGPPPCVLQGSQGGGDNSPPWKMEPELWPDQHWEMLIGNTCPGSQPQAGGFTNLSQMYYFGDKNEGAL